ncbi:phasin family protein [Halomonas sp. LS-001]
MNKATEKTTQQVESIFVAPMRAYTVKTLDYYDQVISAQIDAARAYTDFSVAQMRTWLDVKDAESMKEAVQSQQKAATDLMERFKGDAEKIGALSQSFLQDGQKMAEDNLKSVTDATQKAATK